MITFFRRLRGKFVGEGNIRRYLIYAVGEILLVMIGILLALQVNNWNEHRKDIRLEQRYLAQIVGDLRQDSLNLATMMQRSDSQVEAKQLLIDYMDGRIEAPDSLKVLFDLQWALPFSFNYITRTIDEMSSSGTLDVIRDQQTRDLLLKIYNRYDQFNSETLASYYILNQNRLDLFYQIIPDLYSLSDSQVAEALKNFQVKNSILGNSAFGINTELKELLQENSIAIRTIIENNGL